MVFLVCPGLADIRVHSVAWLGLDHLGWPVSHGWQLTWGQPTQTRWLVHISLIIQQTIPEIFRWRWLQSYQKQPAERISLNMQLKVQKNVLFTHYLHSILFYRPKQFTRMSLWSWRVMETGRENIVAKFANIISCRYFISS